ncbi:glycoside hydrolase family 28 protein [Mucilaginibacter terrae]|uniref:Exo-poly-alpha-galacturonosidase n=1 Tax=Mucilaginibacter terrae TaxID=1955052 RepID=A0ABU3GXJ6_9SPHI|nr:glycoside hydrolase family 28 protein [Mucilaginibacter terrae]MDT3403717.1 exo-poly-alpha-galacturonosidase [Mucilaginibacter terrae]
MKKYFLLLVCFTHVVVVSFAAKAPKQVIVAPGTLSAASATLVWDKPDQAVRYHIILNGKEVGAVSKSNYMLTGLTPSTAYNCVVKTEGADGKLSGNSKPVKFTTTPQGKVLNITEFGARGDGSTINTKAIQKSIDACPEYGTVLIPEGNFVSGALFLKSRMTLQIEKGGTLKGSPNTEDYEPFINNRFEGWEMKTYASLINAGTMDSNGGYTTQQISIKGEGTISGGGGALGKAMIDKHGMRSRGRLIMLMNCQNVELQGLQIKDAPCWTIHYIYSKGISCHDLDIVSTAHNGDGLDPDSSDDSYIFNCSFSTGDDCIAIKSGKNPEGYTIGRPTRNVQITNCNFTKGHGISIGSEMSGGVSDVLVQDCTAGALLNGMQIKGTKERGGYVKNVTVTDCQLLKITIFSALNYNNDGAAAPLPPTFENFIFKNIDLKAATIKEPVININGFKDPAHKLKNVRFDNIIMPNGSKVIVNDAQNVRFANVKMINGSKPDYSLNNSTQTTY